jgi:hypothetical protein
MWTVILRSILPMIVLLAGIAAVVYGAVYHSQPVTEEQEIEIEIAPPPGFGGPPGFGPPMDDGFGPPMDDGFGPPMDGGFGDPSMGGMMPPPPFLDKIKETVVITEPETEASLMREVSIGGVTLLAEGILRRTYSGDPPLLCPS